MKFKALERFRAKLAADEPVWLLYQRGLERMTAGEYGEALELFEQIKSRLARANERSCPLD